MPEQYSGTKFKTIFEKKKKVKNGKINELIKELIKWCKEFSKLGLIPSSGGGYAGNLSFRTDDGFIITATGADLRDIDEGNFVEITHADARKKQVFARGLKEPSSESFMHCKVYQKRKNANAVFHVHDDLVLKHAKKLNLPTTGREQPYGTVELADEVSKIINKNNYIIIRNHGILSLGKSIEEAGTLIIKKHREASDI